MRITPLEPRVDGGGGSVLEDLHRLDVVGVEEVDFIAYGHTVDHVERAGTVDGSHTADNNLWLHAGAAARGNLNTVDLALKGVHGVAGGHFGNVLAFDGGDRAGEVGALNLAVTDHDHFVENVGIFLEDNVYDGACNFHFLCLHSDIGYHERLARFSLNGIIAVDIGTGAFGGAFHQNGCPDKGLIVGS